LDPVGIFPWRNLQQQTWSFPAAGQPGSRKVVQIAVQRAGLAPAVLNAEGGGSQYQGLLRITDGAGFRRWLSVTAEVPGGTGLARGGGVEGPMGLYVGNVTVDSVSWVTAGARTWTNQDPVDPQLDPGSEDDDRLAPRPVASPFSFPLLVHRDSMGVSKMIHEVTIMWHPPTENESGGRYVLVTPECPPDVRNGLEAGSIQDGQPFSRRMSTAAFYFETEAGNPFDLVLSGDLQSELSGQVDLPGNHRLNPFRHRYHPDHDCDQEGECPDISRTFDLQFESQPPPGSAATGWGDSTLGGKYFEVLEGLHREPIRVSGRFEMRRVSLISTLNDQAP
jgi:hypothetical protein